MAQHLLYYPMKASCCVMRLKAAASAALTATRLPRARARVRDASRALTQRSHNISRITQKDVWTTDI